jgi:phosphonate transport system permease protein
MNSAAVSPARFFRIRNARFALAFALIAVLGMASAIITDYDVISSFTAIPKVAVWMVKNLVPDIKAIAKLPDILDKLLETVSISIVATTCATIIAIGLAITGSKTTRVHPAFSLFARFLASILRNIPVVAWAMIFLLSFGQSSFTGFLAIFFESLGFLTRAFMETIDEAASSPVEALKATGATYGQTVVQAVLPSSLPQMVSWILYMIETNIRSATLVGILTGSGIGFAFDLYYKSLNYKAASLVVLSIVIIVLLVETISNAIRREIL